MVCGSCKGNHARATDVRSCYSEADQAAAEQRAEIYAEAGMSFVAGGGTPEDAMRYAAVIASGQEWDGGLPSLDGIDTDAKCEHGMSAWLCEGPQHYPMDM